MFERFTAAAKHAVTRAAREAERMSAPEVTPEHLTLALLANAATSTGLLLAEHGVTRDDITSAYAQARRRGGLTDTEATALRGLGIDVVDSVDSVEGAHGSGALSARPRRRRLLGRNHIPFGTEAKKALERTLREAMDLGDRQLSDAHLLLALLNSPTPTADALARCDLTYTAVRTRLNRAA